mmetsp:Transcript_47409/g.151845  ORF Transcript_47409/g.151845 Transcript_47409/m.151845 type:complete len:611 (+) Transcript_47409:155-1987(+)
MVLQAMLLCGAAPHPRMPRSQHGTSATAGLSERAPLSGARPSAAASRGRHCGPTPPQWGLVSPAPRRFHPCAGFLERIGLRRKADTKEASTEVQEVAEEARELELEVKGAVGPAEGEGEEEGPEVSTAAVGEAEGAGAAEDPFPADSGEDKDDAEWEGEAEGEGEAAAVGAEEPTVAWQDSEDPTTPYFPSAHGKRDTKRKNARREELKARLKRADQRRVLWDHLSNPKNRPRPSKKDREMIEKAKGLDPEASGSYCIIDSEDFGNTVCIHFIGETLLEFPPGDPIGEGTYSDVYSAGLAGEAVLKCSLPFPGKKSGVIMGTGMEVAANEALILEGLEPHPHVVALLSAHVDRRRHEAMVLLNFAGGCLHDMRMRGEVTPREVREWAEQLLSALVHLHGSRVAHRDIKAANVLIDRRDDDYPMGKATLIDFGVSRPPSGEEIFEDSSEYGTSGYQAPELLTGKVGISSNAWTQVDVFALGCTLYFLVTGLDLLMDPFDLAPVEGRRTGEVDTCDEVDSLSRFPELALTPDEIRTMVSRELIPLRFAPRVEPVEGGLRAHLYATVGEGAEDARQPPEFADLLYRMLLKDPSERITADEALEVMRGINAAYP